MLPARVPASTYRLQFSRSFRFRDARGLVPYLERLGVTDLYASPLLAARHGSSHGYDVVDPTRLNPELGSPEEFDALAAELASRGMGLLLDIVPNHMAACGENRWWTDLLEHGEDSPYAGFFDVDWRSPRKALERKVLLPILGEAYGKVLEQGGFSLRRTGDGFALEVHGIRLPLAAASWTAILGHRPEALEEALGADHPVFREFWEILSDLERLSAAVSAGTGTPGQRREREEGIRKRLAALCAAAPEVRAHLDETLRILSGVRGRPESFDPLDRLLSRQHYWLSFWRLANEEINYRRFFAINDLVSLRVEDPEVFAASHALILRLVREGKATGLRIDHVDGLFDPTGYLERLARACTGEPAGGAAPPFLVVEKILAEGEPLPAEWPVQGTTGYGFLNALNDLFVDPEGFRRLGEVCIRFTGERRPFADRVYRAKKRVMESLFAGEMHSLGQDLARLAERDRHGRDLPRKELREALIETTACFPVYRTYIRDLSLTPRDRRYLGTALREARRRSGETSAPVFDFLRRVLLLSGPDAFPGKRHGEWLRFLMRWQQFTGPIMAKGVEDTALYLHPRLVSRNEVGGHPEGEAGSPEAFHRRAEAFRRRRPHSLCATATHDTKRGEDVRARINVLSEIPREWERHVNRWRRWNEGLRPTVGGRPVPDRNEEYLLYQTLIGAWPMGEREMPPFAARIRDYMIKAIREAKENTRWIRPDPAYEKGVREFVDAILREERENRFLKDFRPFQRKVSWYGMINGLSQVLLKIASPGVPDFYQGCEFWDLRLVDPDNRGPVDFRIRRRMLEEFRAAGTGGLRPLVRELLKRPEDGRIKLFLTWKALAFRREQAALFADGDYLPLSASGGKRSHLLAFARRLGPRWAVAAVPLRATRLGPPGEFPLGRKAWGSRGHLLLPPGAPRRWRNVLTGEPLEAAGASGGPELPLPLLFRDLPAALLSSDPA
ncbi:MAG: malto-oligosyltrehalose synthase [Deltaproteobacteria bacterium]